MFSSVSAGSYSLIRIRLGRVNLNLIVQIDGSFGRLAKMRMSKKNVIDTLPPCDC